MQKTDRQGREKPWRQECCRGKDGYQNGSSTHKTMLSFSGGKTECGSTTLREAAGVHPGAGGGLCLPLEHSDRPFPAF